MGDFNRPRSGGFRGNRGFGGQRSSTGFARSSSSSSRSSGSSSSSSGYSRSSGSSSGSSYRPHSRGGSFGGGRSRFSSPRGGNRGRGGRRMGERIDASRYIRKAELADNTIIHIPEWNYDELKVNKVLKENILKHGFTAPTPIQEKAVQPILDGKDFLGIANTGTGKTGAFLIPLIEQVFKNRDMQILIVVPTRELASQINEELLKLTRDLRMYSVQCIGGASINPQINALRRGFNFIVGTPGRLNDLIERRVLNLSTFSTVVLDEVDRMLDMGFVDEIKQLINRLPEERQSLFFSATLNNKVEAIMHLMLKNGYEKVSVVTGSTAKNVDQDIIKVVDRKEKINKLQDLLSTKGFDKVLVFVSTKREVDYLEEILQGNNFRVEAIHGDKRQRQRERAIENFKRGVAKILLATDVAARGLDIANVSHVINYDEPNTYDDYVHRIGRTGRADKSGVALTFIQERKF